MKKKFKTEISEFRNVLSFLHEEIFKYLDRNAFMRLSVVVEEIFINIVKYSHMGKNEDVEIEIKNNIEDRVITIIFVDTGIPFDPLAVCDPDITLPANERCIGGLGIYLAKKIMDNIEYEYKDNKNILSIQKNY